MKKFTLVGFLCASSLMAQVQLGRNVQIGGLGTGSTVTLQTNGVNNADQTLFDAVQGTNMTITNTSGGHVRFDAAPVSKGITPQVVPPIAGQYVILYPTAVVNKVGDGGTGSIVSNLTSAVDTNGPSGGPLSDNIWGATWSGFALPSYVLPGNVTAVYAFQVNAMSSANATIYDHCAGGSGTPVVYGLTPNGPTSPNWTGTGGWVLQQFTALMGAVTGSNINTVVCNSRSDRSLFTSIIGIHTTDAVGLIVYYTGSAPPVDSRLQIVAPLSFNEASNTLGVDTTGLGGLSGQTANYLPKATTSTTSTGPSIISDDGATATVHGGVAVADPTHPSQIAMAYSSGHAPVPAAGSAVFAPDATGNGTLSENGAAVSRICTAANGICAGTGNTTSTALTTNFFSKSNGANSIINSLVSESGGLNVPENINMTGAGGVGWGIDSTEGTAPFSPLATHDFLYADAASHCLMYSPNGSAFACLGTGGGGTPGGSSTQIQFNNAGSFGGDANFIWDFTNHKLKTGPSATYICTDCTSFVASAGLHTAEWHGTSTLDNRAAVVLSGNFGGTSVGLWEFGTDGANNGGKDFYFYDYTSGTDPFFIDTTDIINGTGFAATSNKTFGWRSTTAVNTGSVDTAFSRDSAGVVDCGNGTVGDKSCTFNAATGTFGTSLTVAGNNVCQSTGTNCPVVGGSATVASAEVVSFSATPTFSVSFNTSRIVLTANITSFTLGAGSDGQDKTLCFKQGAGPYTVTPPANVHGFFTVGTVNAAWSCQSFNYDNTDSIWLATSSGVVNE